METLAKAETTPSPLSISRGEFIALIAALMATNSLAIDIMLPGLQQIGAALGVADQNARQLVVTAYIIGFGISQLAFGPISDRFGRRGPLIGGMLLYIAAASSAALAPSFAALLTLRFVQGVGAAATRVITVSVVRDTFGGRRMAEVMSLVMMVFMILPVIAPGTGQLIMFVGEWQLIFVFMASLATAFTLWAILRLPETLPIGRRRPLTASSLVGGFRIVLGERVALAYTLATACIFGALFGFINSAQQIYIDIYHVGAKFPLYFALVAGAMAVSSFLNSRFVGRFGMRRLSHGALIGFFVLSLIWVGLSLVGHMPLPLFLVLFGGAMFLFGAIGANFNALAMEPLGQVAGTASAVLGSVQTVVGGTIGAIIGQAFDGTVTPLGLGFALVSAAALLLVLKGEGGRLFQPHNEAIR